MRDHVRRTIEKGSDLSSRALGGCYYCGSPATSVEHVPPRCLFPESKDAAGQDYRRNLITVPSCDTHNSAKSADDEFLLASLVPMITNNELASLHTNTKLRRAVTRTGRLMPAAMRDAELIRLDLPDGRKAVAMVGRPDYPRLCRALEHVARGVYYHVLGETFDGECVVNPEFVKSVSRQREDLMALSRLLVEQERDTWTMVGDNPQVFTAHVGPVDSRGMRAALLDFYQGSRVFVAFRPQGNVSGA